MKNFILLVALITFSAHAGTCTSISRTNYTTGQVLTSSSLNTNLNTAYSAINALDGGCVTDGTLEDGSLNTTDFETLLKAPQMGCSVSYSSANTLTVSKCYTAVNGSYVQKSTTTNVTMGCANCSSDSVSTTYYLYIATGSSGSTLTGLILTTAPNADGYDNSGNKVIARFYNNASSDIDQYSIDQWIINKFIPGDFSEINYTPTGLWVTNATYAGKFKRKGNMMEVEIEVATTGTPTTSTLRVDIPTGYLIDSAKLVDVLFYTNLGRGSLSDATSNTFDGVVSYVDTNTLEIAAINAAGTYSFQTPVNATVPFAWANGDAAIVKAIFPIVGWNN